MEMEQMSRLTDEQMNQKMSWILDNLTGGWGSGGSTTVESFVSLWCERFDGAARDLTFDTNSARFQTDLSSIHLRGTGTVSVLLVGGSGPPVTSAIKRFKHDAWFGRALPIVLFATDAAFAEGSTLLNRGRGVMLSPTQIRLTTQSADPGKELRFQMLRQMPFRRLIPFSITHPAEGSMFFGRQDELEQLLYEDHVEYALWGLGDIGKSSLLRQVKWRLRRELDPRYERIVEVDLYNCPPDIDIAARWIAQQIHHTSFSDRLAACELEAFLRRMHGKHSRFSDGPIELLIDEVDEVLKHDKRSGYPLLKALRHARSSGLIRLTICGREGPKEVFEDRNYPFRSEMKRIVLGPLASKDAVDLLLQPLKHLGVELLDTNGLLRAVLSVCKGNPCSIQRWGLEIANRAARDPRRPFTPSDLREIQKHFAQARAA